MDSYHNPIKQEEEKLIKDILNNSHCNKQTYDQVLAKIKPKGNISYENSRKK
jgi:hypothetical protein